MTAKFLKEIEKGTKNALMKKKIINFFIENKFAPLADLAKHMNVSIPTATKIVDEMVLDGFLMTCGKLETGGGRRPSLYSLNPDSCYFGGVDVKSDSISLGLINFCGEMVNQAELPFPFTNNQADLDYLCDMVRHFIDDSHINPEQILNTNVNISGRVNPMTGYSYSYFNFSEMPLSDVMSEKIGTPVCIENDTRSMTFGEYMLGDHHSVNNMLFVNIGWGLGLGIIIDGKIYAGKSGFSGEFGHMPTYDNEVMCHCGKKGCLETEVSGRAILRKLEKELQAGANSILAEKFKKTSHISLEEILDALAKEDMLCIEIVEKVGAELGRWLAGLINVFNPEKVILGGLIASTGDYILQPVRTSVRRYSLNLVNQDTKIVLSKLGAKCGLMGACILARSRAFETVDD